MFGARNLKFWVLPLLSGKRRRRSRGLRPQNWPRVYLQRVDGRPSSPHRPPLGVLWVPFGGFWIWVFPVKGGIPIRPMIPGEASRARGLTTWNCARRFMAHGVSQGFCFHLLWPRSPMPDNVLSKKPLMSKRFYHDVQGAYKHQGFGIPRQGPLRYHPNPTQNLKSL